jgi:hypothetical protein
MYPERTLNLVYKLDPVDVTLSNPTNQIFELSLLVPLTQRYASYADSGNSPVHDRTLIAYLY